MKTCPDRPATRRAGITLLLGLTLAGLAPAAQATTLLRRAELPALVEESARAVLAEVVEVRFGYDERKLHSTWILLRVEEALYGADVAAPGETLTIKVYGSPATMPDGSRFFLEGTPRLRPGERYLLLLIEKSAWGFTNTAGLFQGAFRVTPAPGGGLVAESLGGNRGLFGEGGLARWLEPARAGDPEGALPVDAGSPVPYELLRAAVLRIWTDLGRAPLDLRRPATDEQERGRP